MLGSAVGMCCCCCCCGCGVERGLLGKDIVSPDEHEVTVMGSSTGASTDVAGDEEVDDDDEVDDKDDNVWAECTLVASDTCRCWYA